MSRRRDQIQAESSRRIEDRRGRNSGEARELSQNPTTQSSFALPPPLLTRIRNNFPDYRVPAGGDLTGHWAKRGQNGAPPFICQGDFNGDGLNDVALILIGRSDWRLVIFEQRSGGEFFAAYTARPKRRTELPGAGDDTSIEAPQDVVLKTIVKGQVWSPEGGDQPYQVKLRTDGIIFEHLKKLRSADLDETTLIDYKDGQFRQNFAELLVPLEGR